MECLPDRSGVARPVAAKHDTADDDGADEDIPNVA